MNNFLMILAMVLAGCAGFYAGQKHGAWTVHKQAKERNLGHFVMDEDTGWKSFVWNEVKP